jgi:ATP-binding cassette subfamily C (CFTR/MRP) protein 1
VLGADGSIVQQGSFEHLNANPGYVQSLLVQEQDVRTGAQGNNENILAGLSEELEETPDADSRMTGDLSVYLYYAKAIGIWRAIIFLLLMGTYVFFLSYPGKLCSMHPLSHCRSFADNGDS